MKNTYIPLDIIFIDKDKKIMHIAKNNTPFSEETIAPMESIDMFWSSMQDKQKNII
jgi:uncharacterized membrane protein (UPF0127 family)